MYWTGKLSVGCCMLLIVAQHHVGKAYSWTKSWLHSCKCTHVNVEQVRSGLLRHSYAIQTLCISSAAD